MMNKIWTSLLVLIILHSAFGQEVEQLNLTKQKSALYQSESPYQTWFLYEEDGMFYLAELMQTNEEVMNWFKKRKDSQNIFKGQFDYTHQTITFVKQNELDLQMKFSVIKNEENKILLKNLNDQDSYCFNKINIR